MLSEVRRLGRADALIEYERETAGAQPQRPDVLVRPAIAQGRRADLVTRQLFKFRQSRFRRRPALAKDITNSYYRILNVRPGFALEAERILEVEGDHRIPRVLEHEVAQRANGDLLRDLLPLRLIAPCLPRFHLGAR